MATAAQPSAEDVERVATARVLAAIPAAPAVSTAVEPVAVVEAKPTEPERPRSRAGRKAEYEWVEAKQYLEKIVHQRGDPDNEHDEAPDWKSDADIARAVLAHLEHLAKKGEPTPDLGTVSNKIRPWLKALLARAA